jgi:hypothetical protein
MFVFSYDISDGQLEILFKYVVGNICRVFYMSFWRNWLDQNNRQYGSFAEYQQRMSIFKENYIKIQKMNEVFG